MSIYIKLRKNMYQRTCRKLLIVMNGTMGAGKTTYSNKLQTALEQRNYTVFNEGYDKYIINSEQPINEALCRIQSSLAKIKTINENENRTTLNIAVIADTCGDKFKSIKDISKNVLFSVPFDEQWTRYDIFPNYNPSDFDGYFKWTLYNVLNRNRRSDDHTKSYNVNPIDNGIDTCLNIHKNKAFLVFGKVCDISLPIDMEQLQSEHDRYQQYINNNQELEATINDLVNSFESN